MPGAPVIPDRKIIWSPLKAHLRVVVLRYDIKEVVQDEVRLVFCDTIDALSETLVHIDGFPARYSC